MELKFIEQLVQGPKADEIMRNFEGIESFEIKSPAEQLLAIVGSGFFNEKAFYSETFNYQALSATGPVFNPSIDRIKNAGLMSRVNKSNLSELQPEAKLLLALAWEVASSPAPQDLLRIANWARNEMNIRTTPQWLLAVAAEHPRTKKYVRAYCQDIIMRPDEIRDVFCAYMYLFGAAVRDAETKKTIRKGHGLPACLKRGLSDCLSKVGEYGFVKYNTSDRPRFSDVLSMVDRKQGYPVSKPMEQYLFSGDITDEEALPLLTARRELAKMTVFNEETKALARKSRATWEVLSSQFPNDKHVWEVIVEIMAGRTSLDGTKRKTQYMAMLRNLRNFAKNAIDDEHWSMVYEVLADPEEIKNGKQLPFRYLSAARIVSGLEVYHTKWATYLQQGDTIFPKHVGIILNQIMNDSLLYSASLISRLPGITAWAPDESSSMQHAVSKNSMIQRIDVGNLLASIGSVISDTSIAIPFGDIAKIIPMEDNCPILIRMDLLQNAGVGHSTNGQDVVKILLDRKIHVDRIVFFTDCQMQTPNLNDMIKQYRNKINPDVWIHMINTAQMAGSPVPSGKNVQIIGGWDHKILEQIARAEGISYSSTVLSEDEDMEEVVTPAQSDGGYVRANY